MIYFEPKSMDAAFHFAAEENFTNTLKSDELFLMIWRTEKTVMIGSNQVVLSEINEKAAIDNHVRIVRRRSGGGTIFTDSGTFLYTIILPYDNDANFKEIIRTQVASPIANALNDMGIPAVIEGRNDILVDGKKVSGLAQYIKNGKICSHGSLLYDADINLLAEVLKVDEDKIKSKAIPSVRSRVTNLKETMPNPLSTAEFLKELKKRLFAGNTVTEYALTEEDETAISRIKRETFDSGDWTYGKIPKYTFKNSKRYAGGKLDIFLDIEKGLIQSCKIHGDFLGLSPIEELEKILNGSKFRFEKIAAVLNANKKTVLNCLGSISTQEFLDCMFG